MLFYLVTTDRGDVVELLDSNGNAFSAYSYDAWGNPGEVVSRAAGSIDSTLAAAICARQPLRYAGHAFDEHSGLYYLSQRYYDPATFQFLTEDAARDDGEESAYQYCGGDPVGHVDPSGEHRSRSGWHIHHATWFFSVSVGSPQLWLRGGKYSRIRFKITFTIGAHTLTPYLEGAGVAYLTQNWKWYLGYIAGQAHGSFIYRWMGRSHKDVHGFRYRRYGYWSKWFRFKNSRLRAWYGFRSLL